jgi:ribonuclease P protein component
VLPAAHRLRRTREFQGTVRRGVRAGSPLLVVHLAPGPDSAAPAQVGFVVSGTVGGAVARNTVRRRLRHLVRRRLDRLPAGCRLVVRARSAAAGAATSALEHDLDAALTKALSRVGGQR